MINAGDRQLKMLSTTMDGTASVTVKKPPNQNISYNGSGQMKNQNVANSNSTVNNPTIFTSALYSEKSKYLKRNVRLVISNAVGDSFTLENNKMELTGQKYIGIQQDMFTIVLKNINLQAFAQAVNSGYIYVRFVLDDHVVFAGSIKSIQTQRENIVERSMTLNCLMKVTDLLADMVSPITVNSSINIWNVLNLIDNDLVVEIPDEVKNLKFDKNYTFKGTKKGVIDDIIKILNNQLNRMNMKDLPWLDYELNQDGTLNIFGPSSHIEVLNIQPHTGLTDTPTVNDIDITFNSVYKRKLVPGRVVKLNNAYFSTTGTDSAFVYAFDEQGLYVVTEVAYSFSNYPWAFKASCKAVPLSKYQKFALK